MQYALLGFVSTILPDSSGFFSDFVERLQSGAVWGLQPVGAVCFPMEVHGADWRSLLKISQSFHNAEQLLAAATSDCSLMERHAQPHC